METRLKNYEINGSIKGFYLIFSLRMKEQEKISYAVKVQDRLRKKSKGWNGVAEIRKWREARR